MRPGTRPARRGRPGEGLQGTAPWRTGRRRAGDREGGTVARAAKARATVVGARRPAPGGCPMPVRNGRHGSAAARSGPVDAAARTGRIDAAVRWREANDNNWQGAVTDEAPAHLR
jgi:hypothetical protein